MVDEIYELKNSLLEEMMRDVQERGVERLDKDRVDMVKDLAEAEKSCWEAEYYRAVAEAMEGGYGYEGMMGEQMGMRSGQMGYSGMSGAQGGNRSGRGGSRGMYGYRDSRGRYARRGYGMGYQEHIDALKQEMQQADPQERERIMQELRNVGQMQQ